MRSVRKGFFGTGDAKLIVGGKNTYTDVDLGERFRDIRKDNKYTQESLAEVLGITRSAVNGWETGLATPSIQYIIQLSLIYGVSTDYLLGLDEVERIDISSLKQSDKEIIYGIINRLDK